MTNSNTLDHFLDMFDAIPSKRMELTPSEFAEKYRTLTSDVSTVTGRYRYDRVPYLKEIVNCLSPYHPAKIVAVMKAAQIAFTEGVVVNGILWIIANNPGNIMALSANDELSKEMIESRLDQGLHSCNIQHLIRPNTIRKRNQRTGDTSKYKEFAGGRLFAGGLNAIDKLGKQRSIKYGFFDDWDAAPLADKKQGSIFELLQQRFSTAAHSMKQFYISTPETKPSNIESAYLKGDQRKWNVPCPKCKKFIVFEWWDPETKSGVTFEKDDKGKLIESSVGYTCPKCNKFFKEKHKYSMNLKGKWVATAEPSKPGFYSYHVPAFLAASFMYNWTDYAYKYVDIYQNGNESKSKMKVFRNLVQGLPWEEKTINIRSNKLAKNTRRYEHGTVPNALSKKDGNGNIILLTCSADLNGHVDDARIDWEVEGHSESGSIYKIDHGSIGTFQRGKKDDLHREKFTYRTGHKNSVWPLLHNDVINRAYLSDEKASMSLSIVGVDCGYFTNFAYNFIDSVQGIIYGVKGDNPEQKFVKVSKNAPVFKLQRDRSNVYLFDVDKLKDELSEMINLVKVKDMPQPPGFINFPLPNHKQRKYDSYYFKQYEAEERVVDQNDDGDVIGWKWQKKHSSVANHFFDTAVYNLGLRKVFSETLMKEMKQKYATWADFAAVMGKCLG